MSKCACGFNPPADPNPDCERCGLIAENAELRANAWRKQAGVVPSVDSEMAREAEAFEAGAAALEREGQPVAMGILANYSQELGEEFSETEEDES
jgi:hypothetical protein